MESHQSVSHTTGTSMKIREIARRKKILCVKENKQNKVSKRIFYQDKQYQFSDDGSQN